MNNGSLQLNREIPVTGSFDLVIAGGGLSGLAAACNAAARGLTVCVAEYFSKLGGVPSSGLLGIVSGFRLDYENCVDGPFFRELVARAKKRNAVLEADGWAFRFDCELLPLILMEMAQDMKIEVRLLSPVADAKVTEGRVTHAVVASRRGLEAISGKLFIDDTGDALLATAAGADVEIGRDSDGQVQSSSLTFKLIGIDQQETPLVMSEATRIWRSEAHHVPTDHTVITYLPGSGGEASVNMTHILNCNPLSDEGINRIRVEGVQQAIEITEYFRRAMPGFSRCRILETAMQPGVRESRRVVGTARLTAEDVIHGRDWPDQIARCCWGIDVHSPNQPHSTDRLDYFNLSRSFGIPYGCITPKKLINCYVVGRPISVSHEAFAATRINASCIALGEAAGCAAPLALNSGNIHNIDVQKLREELTKQGSIVDYTRCPSE